MVVCVLVSAACSKQFPSTDANLVRISTSSASTRTVLDGKNVLWERGDEISVFDGISNCRFTTDGDGERAVFSGMAVDCESYLALYPYSPSAKFGELSVVTELPQVQNAVSGSFARGANLSFGRTEIVDGENVVSMKNVGAFLKFSIESSYSGINQVRLTAPGGEQLAGTLNIWLTEEGLSLTRSGSLDNESIESEVMVGVNYACVTTPDGFTPGTYYIVFAPGDFSEGLTLSVYYSDGTVKSWALSLDCANRNAIYSINGAIDSESFTFSNEGIMNDVIPLGSTFEGIGTIDTPWNGWTDAASLRDYLLKAAQCGKTYFSNFKYYSYLYNDFADNEYGHPLFYSMDFYEASGTYFPRSQTAPVRQNLINIVKKCWKRNRAVCFFSWHLESPYAVYSEYKQGMGCRYHYKDNTLGDLVYPKNHRYVVREILENTKVDTLGMVRVGDWFDDRVREVADIINEFVDDEGKPIPITFRLWHEQEDTWAWWDYGNIGGETWTSLDEYKALFRLTVQKFREYCPNAEILFGFGPDQYDAYSNRYLRSYPGDDVVDIMGYDDYSIGKVASFENDQKCLNQAITHARVVSKFAKEHNKPAVIFETNNNHAGYIDRYYDDFVLPMLADPQVSLSVFQIWSAFANSEEQKIAFAGFRQNPAIIFDH